ncbi:hypothetical protein Tco_0139768 [Tanacetum coccineum]
MSSNTMAYIIRQAKSSSIVKMNPDIVDKNDPKDVQLEDEHIMYDIASSVETIIATWDFVEKMNYGLTLNQVMARNYKKNWRKRLNDDDVIAVPHEDAKATLGDINDPFNSISMSTDFADKDIADNDAY